MSKFKCTSSVPGTSIRLGAVVKGEWVSDSQFILQEVLDGKCSQTQVGATFPMVGVLWEWEEIK